jgi:hypothetical protein
MGRIIACVGLVLFACAASATVLVPADFRDIVAGSEIIAHVRIVGVRPELVDRRARVESIVTADVLSYFKGGSERTIEFRVPGGRLGRYTTVMVGAPVFERGQEAVLFLVARGTDLPTIFGLSQGVFRIRFDSVTGQRLVAQPPLMSSSDRAEVLRRGATERKPLAIGVFSARVQEVMIAAPRGPRR